MAGRTRRTSSPLDVLGPAVETPAEPEAVERDALVESAAYRDGVRLPDADRSSGSFVWLELYEPSGEQMQRVATEYGLHELVVEDAVSAHQRPKLERYDDVTVVVVRTAHYLPHASVATATDIVESGELLMAIGADFVVTIAHGEQSSLAGVRRKLEANPQRLADGPWAVVHEILDRMVDGYIDVVDSVERDVDSAEAEVLSPDLGMPMEKIYLLKREILELRHGVSPLSAVLTSMSKSDLTIPAEVRTRLRDVANHHAAVAERILAFDEVLSSLVGAASARVNMQQNVDLRKISAWVAIAAFPTALAAIYGMNFDVMPELSWTYGYLVWWVVAVAGSSGLYLNFRRHRWL